MPKKSCMSLSGCSRSDWMCIRKSDVPRWVRGINNMRREYVVYFHHDDMVWICLHVPLMYPLNCQAMKKTAGVLILSMRLCQVVVQTHIYIYICIHVYAQRCIVFLMSHIVGDQLCCFHHSMAHHRQWWGDGWDAATGGAGQGPSVHAVVFSWKEKVVIKGQGYMVGWCRMQEGKSSIHYNPLEICFWDLWVFALHEFDQE